uniref:XK-related protein n=1 Tax=Caenorhabditis tropicalis TaxID=1561998 RepID=A0A1I7TI00_9PELO
MLKKCLNWALWLHLYIYRFLFSCLLLGLACWTKYYEGQIAILKMYLNYCWLLIVIFLLGAWQLALMYVIELFVKPANNLIKAEMYAILWSSGVNLMGILMMTYLYLGYLEWEHFFFNLFIFSFITLIFSTCFAFRIPRCHIRYNYYKWVAILVYLVHIAVLTIANFFLYFEFVPIFCHLVYIAVFGDVAVEFVIVAFGKSVFPGPDVTELAIYG